MDMFCLDSSINIIAIMPIVLIHMSVYLSESVWSVTLSPLCRPMPT